MTELSSLEPSTANVTDLEGQTAILSRGNLNSRILQNPLLTVCTTLIFNSVSVTEIEGGLNVNFVCPICKETWQLTIMFDDYDDSGTYDFNDLINTTFPDHNVPDSERNRELDKAGILQFPIGSDCPFSLTQIALYLAAHLDVNGFQSCIQKSSDEGVDGIPDGWWQTQ